MSMRLEHDQRRTVIVTAATRIAREGGLASVNHGNVAKRCAVPTTPRTVRHYFSRNDLWRAVAAEDPERFGDQAKELGL